MKDFDDIHVVHVIGAGGIGLSAAAKLLKYEGKTVTGSDVHATSVTEELEAAGIPVTIGQRAENVLETVDLVLYSGAVPASNPEREEATRRGIPQMSYFDFIGAFSRAKRTIAVSGTNGKSTTTAMLGMILVDAGLDPTVIVGSKVPVFKDGNLRVGKSDLFVVEACEHEANMLKIAPQTIVLTNIEEDHLDFYRDLDHIRETFQQYVDSLPEDGLLIVNADDHVSAKEIATKGKKVTYGIDTTADYVAGPIVIDDGAQRFAITGKGSALGEFALHVPGRFNVANALAATTTAMELGVSADQCRRSLAAYAGIWRRYERIGERNGALIISDYGHHPTAVAATVRATKEFFPERVVVLLFQPHQHNRTKNLFDAFVASFDDADVLILQEVFDVAGREESDDQVVGSQNLVDAVKARDGERGEIREVWYSATTDSSVAMLSELVKEGDVVLVMGAGSVYLAAQRFIDNA